MTAYPPLQGEGDRGAQRRGGGGSHQLPRPEIVLAPKLRRQLTYPEVMLWQRLRRRALGVHFRKQHEIGPYVVDFCCLSTRLVLEVDGAIHGDPVQMDKDGERDGFLRQNGFRVLRVSASQVKHETDGVIAAIASLVASPLHQPPRPGEDR